MTKKQQKAAQFKAGKKGGKAGAIEDHPATPDDIPEDDAPSTPAPVASTSAAAKKSKAAPSEVAEAPAKEEKVLGSTQKKLPLAARSRLPLPKR